MSRPTLLHSNLPILEVADPVLLDELLLDRQVSAIILTRLSDRVALVDPARFPGMSGRMAAILGYILEAPFSEPVIAELVVTSDG